MVSDADIRCGQGEADNLHHGSNSWFAQRQQCNPRDQQGHPGQRRSARDPCEGVGAQTRRPSRLVPASEGPGTRNIAVAVVNIVGCCRPSREPYYHCIGHGYSSATASFGLPTMSLPLGQQRPLPAWSTVVTPQAPPTVPHLADTAGVPRYHKLDFPIYDGKEDPLGWLNRCEQFFWGQRTAEAYKVWLAAYHMTGTAHTWYMQLERNEGIPSWPRFKNRCHL